MKGVIVHGALLGVMLVYGYRTWTKEEATKPVGGEVVMWTRGEADLTKIEFQTENRLARPYWDFTTDLDAWTASVPSFSDIIEVTAPDRSGFFLSSGLSIQSLLNGGSYTVSQCLPVPVSLEGDVVVAWTELVSAAGNPFARVEFQYFGGPSCGSPLLASGLSTTISGDTGGAWQLIQLILPDPPAGATSQRIYFRGGDVGLTAFEAHFDDLQVFTPLFADGFETGNTVPWDATLGGTP